MAFGRVHTRGKWKRATRWLTEGGRVDWGRKVAPGSEGSGQCAWTRGDELDAATRGTAWGAGNAGVRGPDPWVGAGQGRRQRQRS